MKKLCMTFIEPLSRALLPALTGIFILTACSDMMSIANKRSMPFMLAAPVMNDLTLSATDSDSITLARPDVAAPGFPAPAVQAYVGLDGNISVSGTTVTNFLGGPFDVSGEGCRFSGLIPRKKYRIIVVAQNSVGYDVKYVTKRTMGTGMWTWVSGDNTVNQTGVYGTKGVAADANKPGARNNSVSWIDSKGNFWLFGGLGWDAASSGRLNDLWKFDGSRWTWVSGDSSGDQPGVYGTKGSAANANKAGARWGSVSWIDSDGNLWLFGGEPDVSGASFLNDLWRYSP